MKIARILYDGEERYGIVKENSIELIPNPVRNSIGIESFLDSVFLMESDATIDRSDEKIHWLPPIARPGKVICVGRNYLAHAEEQGRSAEKRPLLFSKYPSNMVGHNSEIQKPQTGKHLDYEVELAVVIGKEAKHVENDVMSYVFGYTVANDLTLRDIQKTDPGKQWTRGKAFDESLPIGPVLVTKDEIEDPMNLEIWLSVNGEIRQKSNTQRMIYDLKYLIRYITESITLYPGDIILTGTPEGVGYFMDPISTLKSGDVVNCGITEVGELKFRIR